MPYWVGLAGNLPKDAASFDLPIALSNLAEEPLAPVTGPVEVPSMGLVTLRAELP